MVDVANSVVVVILRAAYRQVEKNKERLKLEQGDDKVKDSQIARLIDMERVVSIEREDRVILQGTG